MKKIILPGILLWCAFLLQAQVQPVKEIYEFCFIQWGMTREDLQHVKQKLPLFAEENLITVKENFAGSEYLFQYHFTDKGLMKVTAKANETYAVIQNYLLDFDKLQLYIAYFYGEAAEDNLFWGDPLDRERFTENAALLNGAAWQGSVWLTAENRLEILLRKPRDSKVPEVLLILEPVAEKNAKPQAD